MLSITPEKMNELASSISEDDLVKNEMQYIQNKILEAQGRGLFYIEVKDGLSVDNFFTNRSLILHYFLKAGFELHLLSTKVVIAWEIYTDRYIFLKSISALASLVLDKKELVNSTRNFQNGVGISVTTSGRLFILVDGINFVSFKDKDFFQEDPIEWKTVGERQFEIRRALYTVLQ